MRPPCAYAVAVPATKKTAIVVTPKSAIVRVPIKKINTSLSRNRFALNAMKENPVGVKDNTEREG